MKKPRKRFAAAVMIISLLLTGHAVLAAGITPTETDLADCSSGPLIIYDYNGGVDSRNGATSDQFKPAQYGDVLLSDPYYVSCGEDSVFLGWKRESEFYNPGAKLYVDKIKHDNYFYDLGPTETVTFKALWGQKFKVPVYAGENFAFRDAEGNRQEQIEFECLTDNPYGLEFTSALPGQATYSTSLYEGKSEYWLCNPYMDYSRNYILDGFVSNLTGKKFNLNDSYYAVEGDSLTAVWVKSCRIYINFNGGENIRSNISHETTADVVKEGKYYYAYYNNPSRRNTLESRSDRYIVKPGCNFVGWKNSYDGRIYIQGETFIPNGNTIFNAVWEWCDGPEDHGPYTALRTVRYDANGGRFRDASEGRLLSADDHRYRAFFWNLRCRADGYSETDNEPYIFKKKIKVGFFTGDTTNAYDYISRHPYDRLRFATSNEYDNYINKILTCDIPFLVHRSGYRFVGWYLKGDSGNRLYQQGELYDPMGKDVTFVAQWEKVD